MGDTLRSAAMASAFPALAQRINGVPLAYLDNAATTQMPQSVLAAMRRFDECDRANIHRGVHTLSQRATDAYERARDTLTRFVGAGADHLLVFTSGTTDALNLVAQGLSLPGHAPAVLREGDEIVVSALEHHANLVPWQMAARRCGARLRILHPDPQGRLHVKDLERLLTPRTRVFAVTACSNATGERPPYEALLAAARAAGALTVLDAAQAVGHEVPELSTLACDFVAFSGHKMYGPMGTGALAGRRDALERLVPLRFGGDMVSWVSEADATFDALPARLEGGTPNVAGVVGMAAAADYIDEIGRATIDAHVRALRDHAAAGLAAIDGVTVLAERASSAIVSFAADGAHPHDIGTLLDERGIAVRTGYHCAQPLLERLGCGPTTRASFALYNTHDEVERLVAGVARALKVLR
ncbi:aminotransferase class V-fold PLP-dependent enzyme [Burkholderia oklahomensis]|uniref:aminotransferase class V-fold PLP-dependent enzyme n=1 Tax=Burkholderia oklahomensis TaxID=342113 RepID=UPI00016A90B9|nr:SufS family cysteine desulfurase [Burkholderia oklahomensis]AJX32536.1 cysteine desulfurase, SufS family protein [Burkholderia oklahomensis C6786]AOI45408.1 cysteine desulfurase [Burkholderia oklahomensis C6786]KUY63653.1 cysteine desulfurase [Burkholderia oklahomensis C6786]MBI0358513.1 SufS family cysteine desulfurase [Burkholderia oklahomensis]SUW56705.1 Probable cysteine desulfurase [Burkholderia oklahomensis]